MLREDDSDQAESDEEVESPREGPDSDALEVYDELESERLASLSPEEWWEELVDGREPLTKALEDLAKGGCDRSRLLDDLRDLEQLSAGYPTFRSGELPALITRMRQLSETLERLEMSLLRGALTGSRVRSSDLTVYADALEKLQARILKSPRFWITKRIERLTDRVNKKIRRRGRIGKVRQHEALALLISAALHEPRTAAAQRVMTSRMKSSQTKEPAADPKKPRPRGRPPKEAFTQRARNKQPAVELASGMPVELGPGMRVVKRP
jgi:hypothetical protein